MGNRGLQRRGVLTNNLQTPYLTLSLRQNPPLMSSFPGTVGSGLRDGVEPDLLFARSIPTFLCGAAVCLGEDGFQQ